MPLDNAAPIRTLSREIGTEAAPAPPAPNKPHFLATAILASLLLSAAPAGAQGPVDAPITAAMQETADLALADRPTLAVGYGIGHDYGLWSFAAHLPIQDRALIPTARLVVGSRPLSFCPPLYNDPEAECGRGTLTAAMLGAQWAVGSLGPLAGYVGAHLGAHRYSTDTGGSGGWLIGAEAGVRAHFGAGLGAYVEGSGWHTRYVPLASVGAGLFFRIP